MEETMKRLVAVAAIAPLMVFPAVAQDNGAAQMRAAAPTGQESSTQTLNGQISASALLNESVVNANNEPIGDINDVLLDQSGKVASVIVGVGGFLGLGEKDVALNFDQLNFNNNGNDLAVTSDATRETLQAAPAYDKQSTQ
jgi:sporulation protein YlmC with PRC-barrel domain